MYIGSCMNWDEIRREIIRIFQIQSQKINVVANFKLSLIEYAPIEGEYVYGEAFPEEKRIWLEVVAPDASNYEITETIIHELIHLKYPRLDHNSDIFNMKVKEYMNDQYNN